MARGALTLYRLRSFRNSDPPALVDIWRAQPPERGLSLPMSVMLLEHFVFSKPYFDREGLIVAERDGRVIGFVHAGFGPNPIFSDMETKTGVICMLQTDPEFDSPELRRDLLQAVEGYLLKRGVQRIIAGPYPPFNPFYHGLHRACELAGVLSGDVILHDLFSSSGYVAADEFLLLSCSLVFMRSVIDRNQRMLTRTHEVRPLFDHEFDNWWDTCTFGPIQRSCFEIVAKQDATTCGSLIWWDLDLEGSRPGMQTVALTRLEIADPHRRTGLATFLVTSALRQLKSSGAIGARVQIPAANESGILFFRKLGFEEVDRGVSYLKLL